MLIIFILIVLTVLFFVLKKKKKPEIPQSSPVLKKQDIGSSVIPKAKPRKTLDDITFEKSETGINHFLIFDIESHDYPGDSEDPNDLENWPRIVQISWMILDREFKEVKSDSYYINIPIDISEGASGALNITNQFLRDNGVDIKVALNAFLEDLSIVQYIVGHDLKYKISTIDAELLRIGQERVVFKKKKFCTLKLSKKFLRIFEDEREDPPLPFLIPFLYSGGYNDWNFHNSQKDVILTSRLFESMVEMDVVKENQII